MTNAVTHVDSAENNITFDEPTEQDDAEEKAGGADLHPVHGIQTAHLASMGVAAEMGAINEKSLNASLGNIRPLNTSEQKINELKHEFEKVKKERRE